MISIKLFNIGPAVRKRHSRAFIKVLTSHDFTAFSFLKLPAFLVSINETFIDILFTVRKENFIECVLTELLCIRQYYFMSFDRFLTFDSPA